MAANPAYSDPLYRKNRFRLIANTRREGRPCCICGQPFGPDQKITAEHLLPLRLGGTHDLSNLGPAHSACNTGWNRKPRPR